ncbi:DUF2062 domain-containing protein [Sphingomonas alba]|uniref:DUF2062 domain-containing protein n=1 Tax=Sphingomonas alba TaxID=2908208 RepID=A0ABT0RJH6_9SPHN|nr:DUF2062 domain-containing protein [Sphingomonas alba]
MADEPKSGGFMSWVRGHIPTRETIQHNRFLRPFAKQLSQPNLWHFNHRSVPRGVALGLGVGVIIPVMHIVVASVLAIPTRANVLLAAACTLLVNPLTIPPLYYAAYKVGAWELHHEVVVDPNAAAQVSGELSKLLFWVHEASGPIALGVLTIALIASTTGYIVSLLLWNFWVRSKWRARRMERRAATK